MRARVVAPLVAAILGIGGGVATAFVVPGDDVPGSTDEPTSKPTAGPTAITTVNDPLHLGIPLVNQDCSGEALLVIGYGSTRAPLSSAVANSSPKGLSYLRGTGSCDTVLGPEGKPRPAYIVYRGPYDGRREPCETRMSGDESGSFVTVLRSGNTQLVKCPCEIPSSEAPRLSLDMGAPDQAEALWTRGLQSMFSDDDPERFPHTAITGSYDEQTAARVTLFQENAPGKVTEPGVMDHTTWGIITDRLCRNYDY
jgi:hypothetical protein